MDFLKSKIRLKCENVFDFLLDYNFKKEYQIYGREKTLTYINNKLKLSVFWETNSGNPTIIFHNLNYDITIESLEKEIRENNKFIKADNQNYLNWVFNIMSLDDYLMTFKNRIISELK